jgi:hypothetical protein
MTFVKAEGLGHLGPGRAERRFQALRAKRSAGRPRSAASKGTRP